MVDSLHHSLEPPKRLSVFREVGLVDEDDESRAPISSLRLQRPALRVRFRSSNSIIPDGEDRYETDEWEDIDEDKDEYDFEQSDSVVMTSRTSLPYRLTLLALFVALALPIVQSAPFFGNTRGTSLGPRRSVVQGDSLQKREDSPTDICKRWSHQSAIVNGTLWMYGGRATSGPQQDSDTWNNYLVSLDLTKTWQVSEPALKGYPIPDGPPPVANGFLWNSHDSLYLYGGQFSDKPATSPVPESLWEYDILSGNWVEHESPKTSAGDKAEPEGQLVQRSSEGAGAGVAAAGRGWYFGGHLDTFTTYEWDISIARVYIKSLIEFTLPGFSNNAVESLKDGKTAGEGGVWRNITEGGVQDTSGFPERADGLLVHVPGFGDEGILLGLAGGTNATFTQMNVIDVYDIATSTWYKQSTSGTAPKERVNPCAVVAAAPDGSSYNMYMYGGQNLQPYQHQIQYNDMWILSIPSFTWIEVNPGTQVPPGRSGHTCNIWDGQLILIGGYVGEELSCDAPGIYVFNLTSLTWNNQFTSMTGSEAVSSNPSDDAHNPYSQQGNQLSHENEGTGGLEGSFGYEVPPPVYSAVGGGPLGGATITKPVATPAGGPLATGSPITYTVTGPNGEVITNVAAGGGGGGNNGNNGGGGPNVGAIVAGTIAGVFAIIAGYFAFCAWVYRKQVQLYKNHAAMASRHNGNTAEKDGFLGGAALSTGKVSSERPTSHSYTPSLTATHTHSRNDSSGNNGISTAYTGAAGENVARASIDSTDDLLAGQEPSFWGTRGVLLNPRRSLRVINRD